MGRVKADANEATDLEILKILSMNGRATLDFIGKRVGLSKHPTYRRVKMLEEKYGIRYIPEIDVSKFGYLGYIAFVRFKGKVPSLDELHRVFDSEPHVQLVLLTSGRYDMVVYFLSDSHRNVAYFIYELKTATIFAKYRAYWYVTPSYASQFILPLRNVYFDLLSKKVWHKTKENKKPDQEEITETEFNVLKELNNNGAVNFTDIDKNYKQGIGTSRYAYTKLKTKDILKRITITMDKLPIKYNIVFLMNDFYGIAVNKTRAYLLAEFIREGKLINKYCYESEIGYPGSVMLVMPVLVDDQEKQTEDYFGKKVKGISIKKLVVTKVAIGSFVYRRFDTTYMNQYKILIDEYKFMKPKERVRYDEDTIQENNLETIELSSIRKK